MAIEQFGLGSAQKAETMSDDPPKLRFQVSSGLKSVLGSELITDDQVAFFELVKNSFDAGASNVELYFGEDRIVVSDNGSGMSLDDIKSRWLRVAYSMKRETQEGTDFRDRSSKGRTYAGSKGIGRFSTDRLGGSVLLQSRPREADNGPVHTVSVDWKRFDMDRNTRFEELELDYKSEQVFNVPVEIEPPSHGTVITIADLSDSWDREKILGLKSALAKLINPFGVAADDFRIIVYAPSEEQADEAILRSEIADQNRVVNGEVRNFIFETLSERTTFLEVTIDDGQQTLESRLIDRGELVYQIREPNEFPLLANSGFRCQLFFLNHSAKSTFTRRMGVQPVKFGSVFLFRNGFRVYPIGNEGDDWFGMDRRKQQGYRRFLGTRDVIGRLDVFAQSDRDFQESTSRNDGLIDSPEVAELRKCFRDKCLVRLERYVVPVTFADREDKNSSDISRLLTDHGRLRVSEAIASLVDNKNIELLAYSKNLVRIVDERSSQFESSLRSLRAIATKASDRELLTGLEKAERRFEELRRSEEVARKQADDERRAKEEALARAGAAERRADTANANLEEERKRNLFLSSISSLDMETIINLHHQVTLYSVDINQRIENFIGKLASVQSVSSNDVVASLEGISFLNRKVMGIARFATKANFRLESEKISGDLGEYVQQYIRDVASDFLSGRILVKVSNDGPGSEQRFKPIDIAIVIDNLISNSRKAKASVINFEITHASEVITLIVSDDGNGIDVGITDPERIFEKGFTTTYGSGLGLYHVKTILADMNGTIEVMRSSARGTSFRVRIAQ